jgi:hypothetical protein
MTVNEVQQLVEDEIRGRWSKSNDHGVDLRRCLVSPRLVECKNTFPLPDRPQPRTLQMWVVLEEIPASGKGYVILFDEAKRAFGLGAFAKDGGIVFIGYHGSFWNTLEGM